MKTLSIAIVWLVSLIATGCGTSNASKTTGPAPSASPEPEPATLQKYNADIESVRNAVLPSYTSTTIGKAFEGTFDNAIWSESQTPKSQLVVEFSGTILQTRLASQLRSEHGDYGVLEMRKTCDKKFGIMRLIDQEKPENADKVKQADVCVAQTQIPVHFRFTLTEDKSDFTLTDMGKFFLGHTQAEVLNFIYKR